MMGCLISSAMFAAPVRDLREALIDGSLGALNPVPWAWALTNCLGWTVYGYYRRDPFVVAANLPGLVLGIWLNSGAAKLQYLELFEARKRRHNNSEHWDASRPMDETQEVVANERETEEMFVVVPQEQLLLRLLSSWSVIIVYAGWFSSNDPGNLIGFLVNLNLIVFFAAPLQTMRTVIRTNNSASIHVPTMCMNWLNTSFWLAYGMSIGDVYICIPNGLGLMLGIAQGILRAFYPARPSGDFAAVPSSLPPEEEVPHVSSTDNRVSFRPTS